MEMKNESFESIMTMSYSMFKWIIKTKTDLEEKKRRKMDEMARDQKSQSKIDENKYKHEQRKQEVKSREMSRRNKV
jgi:hypothetical protein